MTVTVLEVAVNSLLDRLATGGAYAQFAPQEARTPYLIFQRISRVGWRSLTGPSGMAQARMQIASYDKGYLTAKQLAGTVRQKLDGFYGTVMGVRIAACSLMNETDLFDDTVKPRLHQINQDYLFTFDEI